MREKVPRRISSRVSAKAALAVSLASRAPTSQNGIEKAAKSAGPPPVNAGTPGIASGERCEQGGGRKMCEVQLLAPTNG